MSNVIDMLTKSGYEIFSVGKETLPGTLVKNGEPVGFLLPDFSLSLVTEHEQERDSLNKAISFAMDNQNLETIEGEYKLSQYQNAVLTTGYDFYEQKPVYNIYKMNSDKTLNQIGNFEDKQRAALEFASVSGLTPGEVERHAPVVDRISLFVDAIKEKGFSLIASHQEAHRAYEIADSSGKVVGYIGKNNKVTITTEDRKAKNFLSDTYIDTNPNKVVLPTFFEKLKNRLKEIECVLKVKLSLYEPQYVIKNNLEEEIANITGQHEITYTDRATSEQTQKIDNMIAEIERENQVRHQAIVPDHAPVQNQPAAEVTDRRQIQKPIVQAVKPHIPEISSDDLQKLASAVLGSKNLSAQLDVQLLNKLNRLTPEQQPATLQKDAPTGIIQNADKAESAHSLSPAEQQISEEFMQYSQLMQTIESFSPTMAKETAQIMEQKFGTTDSKEFEAKLQRGDYAEPKTLSKKLKVSQQKADIQNDRTRNQEPTKEQAKEQERGY